VNCVFGPLRASLKVIIHHPPSFIPHSLLFRLKIATKLEVVKEVVETRVTATVEEA
jgi:hypothetical protein